MSKKTCFPLCGARRPASGGIGTEASSSSSSCSARLEWGEEAASTGSLSDDSLLHAFSFLPTRPRLSRAALTCRRWRRLCCSHPVRELVPSLFSSDEKPWGSLREKDIMNLMWCHASTLEKLCLFGMKHLKGDQIIPLIKSLPKLKDLAIISCPSLLSSDIEDIARYLPSDLVTLDLHVDQLVGLCVPPLLYDSFITSFQKQYPCLRKLDLDNESRITLGGLHSLLDTFPGLYSLDLHSHLIGWPEVRIIFMKCTSLVHFSLVSQRLSEDLSSSDEEDAVDFLRGRRRLNMYGHSRSTALPASLCSVVPPSLSSLRLYSFRNHSIAMDLPPIASLLKDSGYRLRHLHAQSLFNTSWHTISVWCANLQTLDLSHARDKQLITTGIEEVVLCGIPRLLRNLVRISLPSVNDRILVEFGRFCSLLREMHFEGYGSASSNICLHGSVTDRGVVALAEGCSDLQVLSLAGSNVTIASLRALSFHCHGIEVLYMNRCNMVKDEAIELLWSRMGNCLQLLELGGCPKITSISIKRFLQHIQMHGTSLRVLGIPRSLWNASKNEILKMKELTPYLSIRVASSGISWDGFHHSRMSQFF